MKVRGGGGLYNVVCNCVGERVDNVWCRCGGGRFEPM